MNSPLIDVEVVNKAAEAEGIVSLELAPLNGQMLPTFTPGAHIDLVLPSGLVRQYSLYEHTLHPETYKIAVLREPASRGGSEYVHESVDVGSSLQISAPRNHFELVPARKYILLAGGIGITPIMCMAAKLAADKADFTLHYCCRSRERMAFSEHLSAAAFAQHVYLHIDEESSQPSFDAAAVFANVDPATHLFVCGPKGFMDFVINAAKAAGWQDNNIHFEYFSGVEMTPEDADAFQIKLARCGRLLTVKAEQTVLQVLQDNGVDVPVSCEQGVCGTCVTRVIDGEPEHRDLFLTQAERASNALFTPCCSRAKSALLVLDL